MYIPVCLFCLYIHILGTFCSCAYLLSAGHPAADGWYEDGAKQDLSRMVDQQRDRDQRQMLVALKHDLQHGDTWRKRGDDAGEE